MKNANGGQHLVGPAHIDRSIRNASDSSSVPENVPVDDNRGIGSERHPTAVAFVDGRALASARRDT